MRQQPALSAAEMKLLYDGIYAAHDSARAAQQAEAEGVAERQAKRRALETCHDDLAELPALSSFLRISDAAEACTGAAPSPEDSSCLGKAQIRRDGFERMQRCRLALDALDQVSLYSNTHSLYSNNSSKHRLTVHHRAAGSAATTSACSTRRTSPPARAPSGSWTRQAPSPGRTRRSWSPTAGTRCRRRS